MSWRIVQAPRILRRLLILRKTAEAFYEAKHRAYQEAYAAMRVAKAAGAMPACLHLCAIMQA